MIKVILLVKRKPGLTHDQFRRYYEQNHAPLAGRTMARCVRYIRNYPVLPIAGELDADVITEFWFDLDSPWAAARTRIVDASRQAVLDADEAQFMDRDSMRVVIVDEAHSAPASLSAPELADHTS